jgi:Spy/CpxP family protein refolding chaperone
MKTKSFAMLLLLIVTASALLIAQGPPPGAPPAPPDPATFAQHHVKFLTTVLSLTTAQQQQATTIFTSAATSAQSLLEQMKTAHQSLAAAIKSNDGAAIDQTSATLGGLLAQMTAIHAKAQAAFYQTLTADQQTKFDAVQHEGGPGFKMFFGAGGGEHVIVNGPGPF